MLRVVCWALECHDAEVTWQWTDDVAIDEMQKTHMKSLTKDGHDVDGGKAGVPCVGGGEGGLAHQAVRAL